MRDVRSGADFGDATATSSDGGSDSGDPPTSDASSGSVGESSEATTSGTVSTGDDSSSGETGIACDGDLETDPRNCGACGHDCLDGDCVDGLCQALIIGDGFQWIDGIVPTETTVFISADDGVAALPQDVGPALVITGELARGIQVDDERVYFALLVDDSVASADLNGGDLQTLGTDLGNPWALTLTETDVVVLSPDGLRRIAKAGGPVEILAQPTAPAAYVSQDLAIVGDDLFFATNQGELLRGSLAGGIPEVLATGTTLGGLAVTDAYLYLFDHAVGLGSATVSRVPIDGGELEALLGGQSGVWRLAVDDAFVYWMTGANEADGALLRMPLEGGPATVLADGLPRPLGLAVDEAAVYWGELEGGRVLRLAK